MRLLTKLSLLPPGDVIGNSSPGGDDGTVCSPDRLDDDTRRALERGRRVREILKQPQYEPLSVPEQIAVLVSVGGGIFDDLPIDQVADVERVIRRAVRDEPEVGERIEAGRELSEEAREALLDLARRARADLGTHGAEASTEAEATESPK